MVANTKENRNFAELEVNKQLRYSQILEVLGDNEMTAKEIAQEMYMRGYIPTNELCFASYDRIINTGNNRASRQKKMSMDR